MEFERKVVMVTGAAGTLGRVVVAEFARRGAFLALIDINQNALHAAHPDESANFSLASADLTQPLAAAQACDKVLQRWGKCDVLCNLTGGFRMGPAVHDTSAETWDYLMDVNARTILNTARAMVPMMIGAGSGKIVNVGAIGGVNGRAQMGAYSAAKSAVIRLTESMAAELRYKGINVNCVLPSIIDTPVNRADMPQADHSLWVSPEDLAQVIVFLSSAGARALHGAAIPVVGLS